jgi:hypothetical protein
MTRTGAGYRNPINLGEVYGHSTRTHTDAMSRLFEAPHEPQRRASAPYHAFTAASSGFIPTMFSTRLRL